MIKRPFASRRNRRKRQRSANPSSINTTATSSIVATKWRLALADPCIMSPTTSAYAAWTVQGVAPNSVTIIDQQTIDLGFAAAVVATNIGVIPNNNPAIRTQTGGFVNALTKTF
jgi:hypothetical protein